MNKKVDAAAGLPRSLILGNRVGPFSLAQNHYSFGHGPDKEEKFGRFTHHPKTAAEGLSKQGVGQKKHAYSERETS